MGTFYLRLLAVLLIGVCGNSYPMAREQRSGGLNCSICQSTLLEGGSTATLNCLHTYHTACLVRWATESRTCPLDRKPVNIRQALSRQTGAGVHSSDAVKCVGCLDYIKPQDFELLPFDAEENARRFLCGHSYHVACLVGVVECPAH